jgi:hypothetical protein
MSLPLWMLLGFAGWTLLVLLAGVGVRRWLLIFSGQASLTSFPGDTPHGSPAYRRATRAHANCVENLPVFAAIVLTAHDNRPAFHEFSAAGPGDDRHGGSAGAGSGSERNNMKIHAFLMTRCPIHARRFHRFRIGSNQHGRVVVRMDSGGACCRHFRFGKFRIQPAPDQPSPHVHCTPEELDQVANLVTMS